MHTSKVKQKIFGGFRTRCGLEIFCTLRSYLATLQKQGVHLVHALTLQGKPPQPCFTRTGYVVAQRRADLLSRRPPKRQGSSLHAGLLAHVVLEIDAVLRRAHDAHNFQGDLSRHSELVHQVYNHRCKVGLPMGV